MCQQVLELILTKLIFVEPVPPILKSFVFHTVAHSCSFIFYTVQKFKRSELNVGKEIYNKARNKSHRLILKKKGSTSKIN